ncbi:MAG: phosphatidylglycerol lysyltransferase domain-containing protein [Devosia sp.]
MIAGFNQLTAPGDPIDEALAEVPGVQKVEDANLPMLQEILNRAHWDDPYAGSAGYYGMTGRYGLWLAARAGAFMVMARHPGRPDKLLVFPPAGDNWQRVLAPVLRTVATLPGGFQLARFPPPLAHQAHRLATWAAPNAALSRSDEDALDWRYPVHVLDPAAVASHVGSPFKDFRKNVGRVDASRITTEDLHPHCHRNDVRVINRAWAAVRGQHEASAVAALAQPHLRLLDLMDHLPIKGRLYRLNGEAAGFAIWEETDPAQGVANSLADLTTRRIKGLSEFIYADMCAVISVAGFKTVCIGGSEEAGLDAFKRKMQPVRSVQLASLHYRPALSPQARPALQAW